MCCSIKNMSDVQDLFPIVARRSDEHETRVLRSIEHRTPRVVCECWAVLDRSTRVVCSPKNNPTFIWPAMVVMPWAKVIGSLAKRYKVLVVFWCFDDGWVHKGIVWIWFSVYERKIPHIKWERSACSDFLKPKPPVVWWKIFSTTWGKRRKNRCCRSVVECWRHVLRCWNHVWRWSLVGSKMNVVFLFQISKVGMSVDGGEQSCENVKMVRRWEKKQHKQFAGLFQKEPKRVSQFPKVTIPTQSLRFGHEKQICCEPDNTRRVSMWLRMWVWCKAPQHSQKPHCSQSFLQKPQRKKKGWEKEKNMTVNLTLATTLY